MFDKGNLREIIQEERKNDWLDEGSKDTHSEEEEDIKSKFLVEGEMRGIPSGYESYSDESITFLKHIIEEGCCRQDSTRPKLMPKVPYGK